LTHDEIKTILEKRMFGKIEEFSIINDEVAIRVPPRNLIEVCRYLRESELEFDHPRCISGVDRKDALEVVYHLCSIKKKHKITVKVTLPKEDARVPSLYPVFKGADWHERETAEMVGILFEGHPDPRHLLLMENFKGYPLRKDFVCHNNEEKG